MRQGASGIGQLAFGLHRRGGQPAGLALGKGGGGIDIALHIGPLDVYHRRQRFGHGDHPRRIEQPPGRGHGLPAHPRLVGFQHFARAAVELDAVAIVGNVAARHHQRGDAAGKGMQRQRRSGHKPAEFGHATHVADRTGAGGQDARRAGAQITGQRHRGARGKFALFRHVAQEPGGIAVAHPVGHRHHQAARAAGAKGNARLLHQRPDRLCHCPQPDSRMPSGASLCAM